MCIYIYIHIWIPPPKKKKNNNEKRTTKEERGTIVLERSVEIQRTHRNLGFWKHTHTRITFSLKVNLRTHRKQENNIFSLKVGLGS